MSKKDNTLKKCDALIDRLNNLKKALSDVTSVPSTRAPAAGLPKGWTTTAQGDYHHSVHGIVTPGKQDDGTFIPRHAGGRIRSATNTKGVYPDIASAGAAMGNHMRSMQGLDTNNLNRPSPNTGAGFAKDEDDVEKSNEIKFKDLNNKPVSAYDATANIKRKANNIGDVAGEGKNVNVKAYSSKPGQLSAGQQAAAQAAKDAKKNKKQPDLMAQRTPEEKQSIIAQMQAKINADRVKKSIDWSSHNHIPSADEEVVKLNKNNPVEVAENLMSNQLANMMQGRAMLGTPPPRQPTDEEMFGHLAVSEEVAKNAEQKWAGSMNNWLAEATKPISDRFASEEEEMAYWSSIKVSDNPGSESGY